MDFDGTTFALELLNFGVLVWLLQRFLYRPVLAVIERRRAGEAEAVAAARRARDEAQTLKTQVEQRLAHAAEDRARALAQLDDEIAQARQRRLVAVEAEAAAELQRRQALAERDRAQRAAEVERQAASLALRLAARMLGRVADAALGERLTALALEDLPALSAAQREALRTALADGDGSVEISSAHPLSPARRGELAAALTALAGRPVAPRFGEDPALQAGLRIVAGSWVLSADLRDELAFFATSGADAH